MEKRHFTRVGFTIYATVSYDGRSAEGEVGNISLRGIFIKDIRDIPQGTVTDIRIDLTTAQPQITINIQAIPVRSDSEGTGFEFYKVDVESFTHLRNIVSYASCDENIMGEFVSYLDHKLHDNERK